MTKRKTIISSVNIFTMIIFWVTLQHIIDNYLLSVFISVFVELMVVDGYDLLLSKKITTKTIIIAVIGVIGLFICLLVLFSVLIAIMLIAVLIIQLCLFTYIVVGNSDMEIHSDN